MYNLRFSNLALFVTRGDALRAQRDVLPRVVVYSVRVTFLHFLARERRGCVFLVLRRRVVDLDVMLLWWLSVALSLKVFLILRLRGGDRLYWTLLPRNIGVLKQEGKVNECKGA